MEKKLAQSDKANEALCAGLSSAKEKNDETNKMLSDLIKYDDGRKFTYNMKGESLEVLPDKKKRKAETCDDTKTATFNYKVHIDGNALYAGRDGTYVGGFIIMPEKLGRPGVRRVPHGIGVWTAECPARDNELLKHDGNWKNGKMHGEGTSTSWQPGEQRWFQRGEWCDGVLKK